MELDISGRAVVDAIFVLNQMDALLTFFRVRIWYQSVPIVTAFFTFAPLNIRIAALACLHADSILFAVQDYWLGEACAPRLAFQFLVQNAITLVYALPVVGYRQVVRARSLAHRDASTLDINWILASAFRETVFGVFIFLERVVWALFNAMLLVNEASALVLCNTDFRIF